MRSNEYDVLIVGAGAAGLAALADLTQSGVRALCVEARSRIGGRICTVHDRGSPIPLELGAEFIHGRPPEIWDMVRSDKLAVYDCADSAMHIEGGRVHAHEDAWLPVGALMEDMRRVAGQGSDRSFASFLEGSSHPARAKILSTAFVEGFNAARKEVIGIASLAEDAAASDRIDGDRSFRFARGYDGICHALEDNTPFVRLNTVVKSIQWKTGRVVLQTSSAFTNMAQTLSAAKAIVTLPLGVLQAPPTSAAALHWDPPPREILDAAAALAFGDVFRVVIRFRNAFWEEDKHFADAGFLLSDEVLFPTWWTPLWIRAPILTGWSAGPHADGLLGKPRNFIFAEALGSLSRILKIPTERIANELEQIYFHNWHDDPFSRGAYSYVPAGALDARKRLAEPVEDTLFFAGEATELEGHSATVHGAIASGRRAARQVISEK